MFDFIRKKTVCEALDQGLRAELDNKISFQLKTAQDLAIYSLLREKTGLQIGEIGGGDSRILARLAQKNKCFNIEKFEGADGGPKGVVSLAGVENIPAFVGDFDLALRAQSFDAVFSISVAEHVPTERLDAFHRDLMRILRPGGIFLHAIDIYIEDAPGGYHQDRYGAYREWVTSDPQVVPLGPIRDGPLRFECSMATNPDQVMHEWSRLAPSLGPLRLRAQLASLIVGGMKRTL